MANPVIPRGTRKEQDEFWLVKNHYDLARGDLQIRIQRENGFDESDRLYFGKLKKDWPFETQIFDHQIQPALFRKTARLIGAKPKGRFVAREGSDEVGAFVLNELFNFQWEDVSRSGMPMLLRWALMDQQTRRYGGSYMVCKWRWEERAGKSFFDGPDAQVIFRRDALPNPSYSEIKNWFQYREWVSLSELEKQNDVSRSKNVWKNLNMVKEALNQEAKSKGGYTRSSEYMIKGRTLRSIEDTMGRDPVFKVFELVHELRNERWISFIPKLGVIVRDIPNPYKHGQIPVVHLRYNPNLDDIDGLSEVEIAAPHQRAINALLCAYVDALVQDLYPPLHINPSGVRMHTIEWKTGAKWLMNRPGVDVLRQATTTPGVREFTDAYALMVSSLNNSLGETTAAFSQLQPMGVERTASEIRETTTTRNVYDNFNQVMLADALKRQAYFWLSMNQQYLFHSPKDQMKVVRIVGRDAVNFFTKIGMHEFQQDEAGGVITGPDGGPKYPVTLSGGTVAPQFDLSVTGQEGNLFVTKKDVDGLYDFIPDVESMQVASEQQMEAKLQTALQLLTNPEIIQLMMAEGKKPRVTELIIKLLETTRVIKNAESFFENIQPGQPGIGQPPLPILQTPNGQTQPIQGGAGGGTVGGEAPAVVGAGGVPGLAQPPA